MCLSIRIEEIKNIKRRFREAKKRGKDYIVCYKELELCDDDLLYSPYMSFPYKNGWNKSNRENITLTDIEETYYRVDKGIHVYENFSLKERLY